MSQQGFGSRSLESFGLKRGASMHSGMSDWRIGTWEVLINPLSSFSLLISCHSWVVYVVLWDTLSCWRKHCHQGVLLPWRFNLSEAIFGWILCIKEYQHKSQVFSAECCTFAKWSVVSLISLCSLEKNLPLWFKEEGERRWSLFQLGSKLGYIIVFCSSSIAE